MTGLSIGSVAVESGLPAPLRGPRAAVIPLAAAEIFARAAAFGTATVVARRLGPEIFGVLGFAAALCGYFGVGIAGGLSDLGSREVARDPAHAAVTYRGVLAVRLPLAAAGFLSIILIAWWLPWPPQHRMLIAVSGLSLLTLALDPLWAFKALQRSWLAAAASIAAQVLILAGVFLLVSAPRHALRLPVIQFAVEVTAAVVLAWALVRHQPGTRVLPRGLRLLRESVPLLFGRAMRAVIVSFDIILLGFIAGTAELGVYAAVYRLHFFVLALVVSVQTAHLPPMARAAGDSLALQQTVPDALAGGAVVGAPLVAGGMIIAGPLLAFCFGPPFDQGAQALRWLLVSLLFLFVHGLMHNIYVVTNRTGTEARWFAAAAFVNVLANLLLIPRFGISGAAAATALAEGVILVAGVLVSRVTSPSVVITAWMKPACAAALMAAVVWSTRQVLPVPAQCALGAVVYTGAILALMGPAAAAGRLGL